MKSLLLVLLAGLAISAGAQSNLDGDGLSAAHKARIARFDAGPSSIDVSTYPARARADYQLFREKCALCHTPSRPINSDFALPNEWQLYILRMTSKPGANISGIDSRRIYHFLVYDSSVRKSQLLQKKLDQLSPDLRPAMLAKIAAIKASYQAN